MTQPEHQPEISERDLAELAALADDKLSPRRRARIEARVAGSPQLAALLEEQRRGVAAHLRSVDVQRARVACAGASRRSASARAGAAPAASSCLRGRPWPGAWWPPWRCSRWSWRSRCRGPAGRAWPRPRSWRSCPRRQVPLSPGRRHCSTRTWRAWPSRTGPRSSGGARAAGASTSWTADAARRSSTRRTGKRIGYTILTGDLIEPPEDARAAIREGTRLHYFRDGNRTVVTWPRNGRTCVLSGIGVELDVMLDLAGWKGKGAVDVLASSGIKSRTVRSSGLQAALIDPTKEPTSGTTQPTAGNPPLRAGRRRGRSPARACRTGLRGGHDRRRGGELTVSSNGRRRHRR